jgi:hypothetical protein
MFGYSALAIDGAKPHQTSPSFFDCDRRRRIQERQARGVGLPPEERAQEKTREVGFEDLGRVVLR